MKRRLIMGVTAAGRGLRVLVTSAMLFAVLAAANVGISPSAAWAAQSAWHDGAASVFYTTSGAGNGLPNGAASVFYTTSGAGNGLPNGAEIFAITVRGATVTTRDVGPTYGGDCGSLALSPHGSLYSMCGPIFGAQQLATINQKTGRAHLFGVRVRGLAVMALAFGPNGTLYAVGDCNPDPTFECVPDQDFNALYKVNVRTGAFTRIGPTGAPQFFMDLTFTSHGTMLGVTTTVNPSTVPAILYRINPATGRATKLVTLAGSSAVMGLAFGRDGTLYGTDFTPASNLYRIDPPPAWRPRSPACPSALPAAWN
jgi:hypothetical protein